MMTPREVVRRTVTFTGPDRLGGNLAPGFFQDLHGAGMLRSPDLRPRGNGVDEWGAVWENIGICNLGEVKEFPLRSWDDWDKLTIPDVRDPSRWGDLDDERNRHSDRFILGSGLSLYERVHFIRGLENAWIDIYEHPDKLCMLIDLLVEMNLYAIERYAAAGFDGLMFCDDWGLQDRLMIQPDKWREIWKPRYARVWQAAHDAGLLTFMHSCGYIVDVLDDMIEAGLDVIQMDQQENMTLELLSERFRGRITFWCPVDIQNTMARGDEAEIRAYCHKMVTLLGTDDGGFLAQWYADPTGAGHTDAAVQAMCQEFMTISEAKCRAYYGRK